MSAKWFYSHGGRTHGPVSTEEVKELAAQGRIQEDDLLWQEGTNPRDAVPASAAVSFSSPDGPPSLPDWLGDVETMERKGPSPAPVATTEVSEWLEDLRLWVALDLCPPAKQPSQPTAADTTANPTQTGGMPDWLESWMSPGERQGPERKQPSAPPASATPASTPPGAGLPPPLASPVAKTTKPPVPPSPPLATPVLTPPAAKTPTPPPRGPQATPATVPPAPAPRLEAKPAVSQPVDGLTEKALEETGFDLKTGQILDPGKFQKWKQRQAGSSSTSQPGVSNAALFEAFRKTRTAIESWVDDDKNRLRILHAELEEIKTNPKVVSILSDCANYGKDMQEKLLRHLEFLVQNRRKYYAAVERRSS